MDFLGIGAMELLLILVLAVIVVGPRQLPAIARQLATLTRKLRRMWAEVSTDFARDLNMEDQVGDIRSVTNAIGTVRRTRSPAALIGTLLGDEVGDIPPKPPSPGELFASGSAGKTASSKPPTPAQVLFGEQDSKPAAGAAPSGITFKDKASEESTTEPDSVPETEDSSTGALTADSAPVAVETSEESQTHGS